MAVLRMQIEEGITGHGLQTVFGGMISRSYEIISIGKLEFVEKRLSFIIYHFDLSYL